MKTKIRKVKLESFKKNFLEGSDRIIGGAGFDDPIDRDKKGRPPTHGL